MFPISVKLTLVSVMAFASISNAFSQSEDIQLNCRFVKPENPVEREGLVWKKDVITVEFRISNLSGENLMIPDPSRYSPFSFNFTKSDGDTLDYDIEKLVNSIGFFYDHSLRELRKDGSERFLLNILSNKTIRTSDRMGLAEFEGIEYAFKKSEIYRVHSEYRSELQGVIEIHNTPFRIWRGNVSCDDVLEFRYE